MREKKLIEGITQLFLLNGFIREYIKLCLGISKKNGRSEKNGDFEVVSVFK